jgi:surface carbohydrate biosynthesis protein
MRIYFHIDELGRDAVVASALKKYFNDRGASLWYGNRVDSRALKFHNPFDALIFPSVDLLFAHLGAESVGTNNSLIFILPTESVSGNEDTQNRLKTHLFGVKYAIENNSDVLKKIDKFFLWGEGHLRIMTEASPGAAHKFTIIGHPRHDKLCLGNKNADSMIKQKQIGLVTRFDLINIFDDRHNFEQIFLNKSIGREYQYWYEEGLDAEDHYYCAVQDLRLFFEIINRMDKDANKINIRVHPRENYDNWQKLIIKHNLNVHLSSRWEPFAHWIKSQDYIIAPPSTSFYDCAVLGKSAISIGKISGKRVLHQARNSDDFDPIFEYFPQPESLDELFDLVSSKPVPVRLDLSTRLKELLSQEVGYPGSKNSLEQLCEEVLASFDGQDSLIKTKKKKIIIFIFFRLIYRIRTFLGVFVRRYSYQSSLFILWRSKVKQIDDLIK